VRCGVDGDDAVADHAGEPNVLAKRCGVHSLR
jgi:hypothetical protein